MKKVFSNFINAFDKLEKDKIWYQLVEQGNRYFDMPVPKEHPKCSTTYMGMAICNLALLYKLSNDKKYLQEAIRFMDGVCGYEAWGNAHLVNVDLSASFILFGLSLGYNWLYEDLTNEQKSRYKEKLAKHGKIMYDFKMETEGHGWSTAYYQNHNWINMTGLYLTSYVLDDLAESKKWRECAKHNFEIVYDLMADDGSNYEGVTYWRYGGMWLYLFAMLAKDLENIDYFKKSDYLKNTFYYRLYQTDATLRKQLNFGDCHDRHSSHPVWVYYLFANVYNDGYAQSYADLIFDNYLYEEQYCSKVKPGILPEMWLTYLVYNPNVVKKDISELPKVKYFADLGLVSIRDSWTKDATVFSIKCGHPGGKKQWENGWKIEKEQGYKILALSHHHPDNLSYIYNKGEDYFAIDDGYNRNALPHHHNLLLVDGEECEHMNINDVYMASVRDNIAQNSDYDPKQFVGETTNFVSEAGITAFKMESSKTYKLELAMNEVSRLVLTNNLDYVLFIDSFKSAKEHQYMTHLNSDFYPTLCNGVDIYQGVQSKFYHLVDANVPLDAKEDLRIVKSVMTTQEPDNYCLTKLIGKTYETIDKVKEVNFIEVLSTNKLCFEKIKYGYLIKGENFKDVIYYDGYPDFIKTDAKAVYIREVDEIRKQVVVLEGSYLSINEKELLQEKTNKIWIIEEK